MALLKHLKFLFLDGSRISEDIMLDKSVEFKHIIMKIEAERIKVAGHPTLPEGYSFRFFTTDDEAHWARIETSVLEFEAEGIAREYFTKSFLPRKGELLKRCVFVLDPEGLPIATATAWFANSELGHQASLHWVAVCPEHQGLGIGRAVVQQALMIFHELDPSSPVWLHTQTWSHVAVKLYHGLGFNMMKTAKLANSNTRDGVPKIYQNDYDEAVEILTTVMDGDFLNRLISAAV